MATLTPRRREEKRVLPTSRHRTRPGLSTVELLVAIMILSVVMIGVANLLNASWRSYQNLVWQNKANMEARRALDQICDTIRMGGNDTDMTSFQQSAAPQILANAYIGTPLDVGIEAHVPPGGAASNINAFYFTAAPSLTSNIYYLVGERGPFPIFVAQYVESVSYEYEYRLPAGLSTATAEWNLQRASDLKNISSIPNDPTYFYLPKTVYVTVHVVIPTSVTGATSPYTRTLTSAVTLRGPYDDAAPPARVIR